MANFRPTFTTQNTGTTPQYQFRLNTPQTNTQQQQPTTITPRFNIGGNTTQTTFRPFTPTATGTTPGATTQQPMFRPFGQTTNASPTGTTNFSPSGTTTTQFRPLTNTSPTATTFRPTFGATGTTTTGVQNTFNPYGIRPATTTTTPTTGTSIPGTNTTFNLTGTNQQQQQFSLTGKDYFHESEIQLVLTHLCKLCSPQTLENIFKGVLLNKYPENIDTAQKQEYLRYFTQQDFIPDAQSKLDCPIDRVMIQRALRENPDKENLYPVQVNSLKELLARQKTLRETSETVLKEVKGQIEASEKYERELQQAYFERAIKCASTQMIIVVKYFKVLVQTYNMIEMMSENFREGSAVIPQSVKKFLLDTLDTRLVTISELIEPTHSSGAANLQGESLKSNLERLLSTIGQYMHRQEKIKQERQSKKVDAPTKNVTISEGEEAKQLRVAILELVEVCKRMTFALASQVVEGRATLQVLEETMYKYRK
ncbi:hypothetical protein FGO68_gene1304 [Halteria grandinella]|uniref:Nucleoporin Nup54 alpha-helical domain-containing protein n=1 Tax=Halteria grandinella TaxID=5974 RepID=A0A8J8NRB0_HALGN|nr:hypothetical protein FGO68_gene1304 [Halteria grandinella]